MTYCNSEYLLNTDKLQWRDALNYFY